MLSGKGFMPVLVVFKDRIVQVSENNCVGF